MSSLYNYDYHTTSLSILHLIIYLYIYQKHAVTIIHF